MEAYLAAVNSLDLLEYTRFEENVGFFWRVTIKKANTKPIKQAIHIDG
jgi:hypothetical protein